MGENSENRDCIRLESHAGLNSSDGGRLDSKEEYPLTPEIEKAMVERIRSGTRNKEKLTDIVSFCVVSWGIKQFVLPIVEKIINLFRSSDKQDKNAT